MAQNWSRLLTASPKPRCFPSKKRFEDEGERFSFHLESESADAANDSANSNAIGQPSSRSTDAVDEQPRLDLIPIASECGSSAIQLTCPLGQSKRLGHPLAIESLARFAPMAPLARFGSQCLYEFFAVANSGLAIQQRTRYRSLKTPFNSWKTLSTLMPLLSR